MFCPMAKISLLGGVSPEREGSRAAVKFFLAAGVCVCACLCEWAGVEAEEEGGGCGGEVSGEVWMRCAVLRGWRWLF